MAERFDYGPQPFTVWVSQWRTRTVEMWWVHADRYDRAGGLAMEIDSPQARQMLSDECLSGIGGQRR